MSASDPQLDRTQAFLHARFTEMGLAVRAMSDGRCLLVSLPIGPAPFESVAGPFVIERIVFATLDAGHIKCLRPRPLFGLPFVDVRDARDADGVEAAIRRAWRERTRQLRDTRRWLEERSIEATPVAGGSALAFPLPGEARDAQIHLHDRRAAILPSRGPLEGLPLDDPESRLASLDRSIESGADLECLLSARIDALRRTAQKREAERRTQQVRAGGETPNPAPHPIDAASPQPTRASRHRPKVLLVGSRLLEDGPLRAALERQGYRLATARSETEALMRLARTTPDLVVSEYGLGRSDGASLTAATRALAGIEGIPIVLLDDAKHEARRDAARAVGAAGYVVGPRDPARFVARLGRLIDEPKKRRFTRYTGRFDARLQGLAGPCVATEVGRGGIFLATDADVALHTAMRGQLALPEIGRELDFEGEVLYRAESQGAFPGLGLRFEQLDAEDEAALIAYLERREHRGER